LPDLCPKGADWHLRRHKNMDATISATRALTIAALKKGRDDTFQRT